MLFCPSYNLNLLELNSCMIVWILPGWQEKHPEEELKTYEMLPQDLIERSSGEIRQTFLANKGNSMMKDGNVLVISFQDPGAVNYQLQISKLPVYSPTFPEQYKFVAWSMYNIQLVSENCAVHGIPEKIALLFEPNSSTLEFLDNSALHEIVSRALVNLNDLQTKKFLLMFFSTGMRVNEIASLKIGDLDLRRGTARLPS